MKKHLILTLLLMLGAAVLQAQWQPDVRLTNSSDNSTTSFNNAWCIASSGDVIHVVWYDRRDGNYEIYYKRSADGGISWGADTRLTNNSSLSADPSVTVSGSVVHVVWNDDRDGDLEEIYYKRSTDGGISWGTDTRLTNNPEYSENPSVTVSSSTVHVAWLDYRHGPFNSEIYYKSSTDGGVSWGADTRLTNNNEVSDNPSLAVLGSVVHVVWHDEREGNTEIYYKRSMNAGGNWGSDIRLTSNSEASKYPSVTVSGSVVHVVWYDQRDGFGEIYYKRSIDGGASWGTDTRLTNNSAVSNFPSVAVFDSVVHVIWTDGRDQGYEIYYKRSTDGGVSWGADTRLTNNIASSSHSSVAVSGSVVHVVWNDDRDGNIEIYYKHNLTGNPVGIDDYFLIENVFDFFPNPFSNEISVNITNSEPCEISIYDMNSRKLLQQQFTNEITLTTSQFTNGVYSYELRNKNGVLKRGKIVKN